MKSSGPSKMGVFDLFRQAATPMITPMPTSTNATAPSKLKLVFEQKIKIIIN